MAATKTVAHRLYFRKLDDSSAGPSEIPPIVPSVLKPRNGVVTLSGYGTNVRVDRGHLLVEDGIGSDRYRARFPRVGHGLRRLVAIGSDGVVSLSALRWLADQNASFVMLERNGTVLATTGPAYPSDVKLRRAQALSHHTGAAFRISRELIDRKLAGQERVARESILDHSAASEIRRFRSELAEVESIDGIRVIESRAAKAYWTAWRTVSIQFPEKDLPRVPDHWRAFGARISPLSGAPRLAANPANAILNYLYALLEAECRLAIAAIGLDPEMGVLHVDSTNRDSLACDLMEAFRPDIDAYVLKLIVHSPLNRNWFFEERNGNCRLMATFACQLAETTPTWARLVAPLAEWVLKEIASTTKTYRSIPATRLTHNRTRASKSGIRFSGAPNPSLRIKKLCNGCGKRIRDHNTTCRHCGLAIKVQRLKRVVAPQGRIAAHTPAAEAKRSKASRAQNSAILKWSASEHPSWLTKEFYAAQIHPVLSGLPTQTIASQIKVSYGYAAEIKKGRTPHPRHWLALARLAGLEAVDVPSMRPWKPVLLSRLHVT